MDDDHDNISTQLNGDDSVAGDMALSLASNISHRSSSAMKEAKEQMKSKTEQDHEVYSDELLDYFMLPYNYAQVRKPKPPLNYQPNWIIDSEGHTAIHWASAIGDIEVVKELRNSGADLAAQNYQGETPLMRCVLFTNCLDRQAMPAMVKELFDTIDCVDLCQSTVVHHAAAATINRQKHHSARYYLDVILNKMQEVLDSDHTQRILDAQDVNGNTAIHIAAKNQARKCVRALLGRGASTDIPNADKITAEELILEMNNPDND